VSEFEADSTLRVGVVGCGFQGRLHVACLQQITGVEVVAVCDRNRGRAAELANEHGVEFVYDDHRELLAGHELDVVTVATMPASHRQIVIDALEAGAHVLCEKPFSDRADGALAMVRAARACERTLGVGYNMRFMKAAQAVRAFIAEGELGRPICARGFMLADQVPWWGRHYVNAESGGGALNSTAVHMLDLLMSLTGEWDPVTASASATRLFPTKRGSTVPPHASVAEYDAEDLLAGHVRFSSGFWLTIQGAWVWDEPGWNYSFDLVGDRGQAQLDPLRFSGERDGELTRLWPDAEGGTDFPSSVAGELLDFIDAIRGGRAPEVLPQEALTVQCLVDALYESVALGREVAVVLPDEARVALRP
jgi:predicted dehydrogenase